MQDLVVDTNVFAHAGNGQEPRQEDAIAFIEALVAGETQLCVDAGIDPIEARNRSQIWSEYLAWVPEATVGRAALVHLLGTGRIREVERKVSPHIGKRINRAVHDRTDVVFVKVANNSAEKTLVSHDNAAFTPAAKSLLATCGIRVIDAAVAAPLV